jgi:hypothetical protein
MQYVKALKFELKGAAQIIGGFEAWWFKGSENYLYQTWKFGTNGEKVYSEVNVDPMYGDNLSIVIQESWDVEIQEYNPNYSG